MNQVSASIVAYKTSPDDLVACIRSVLCSSILTKCTVVDNSPTPTLGDFVKDSGAEYVFIGRNIGFGAGHNLALSKNSGSAEYHLVLNPDVSFAPEVLPALHEFMSANSEVGLVMPKVLFLDGSEQRLCKLLPSPSDLVLRRFLGTLGSRLFKSRLDRYELRQHELHETCQVPSLSGCFMFIRNSILDSVGLFDERYFMYMEDVDLCRRIGLRSKTVFYPHVSITHGYAKGSYSSYRLLKHHIRSAVLYFAKWGWFRDQEGKLLNQRVVPFDRNRVDSTFRSQTPSDSYEMSKNTEPVSS